MGFPIAHAGVLPKLIFIAAISLAPISDLCISLLESLGFIKSRSAPNHSPTYADNSATDYPGPLQIYFNPHLHAPADHPLHVRRSAFFDSLQASLPVLLYQLQKHPPLLSSYTHLQRLVECAVCLCEFEAGEEVRGLPSCGHVFHKDCIDGWLMHNHRTCPLCRSSLAIPAVDAQERTREQEHSDQIISWFNSLQQGEGATYLQHLNHTGH